MTNAAGIPASYTWSGGEESLIRFGPDAGPLVIATLPLFEEANRTRTFTVAILRALATRGIASLLPDLPGTGESLIPISGTTMTLMREAYRHLVDPLARDRRIHAIGLRSGALIDATAPVASRWHLAPQTGEDLLRDLRRIRQASDSDDGYAGNALSDAMLAELGTAHPFTDGGVPLRTVRLDTDPRPADRKLPGPPLWRRAEPGNDSVLAEQLAADIADWIASCDG